MEQTAAVVEEWAHGLDAEWKEKSLSLRAFAQSCRRRWTRHSPSDPAIVGSSHRAASSQPGRTNVNKDCATHSEERTYRGRKREKKIETSVMRIIDRLPPAHPPPPAPLGIEPTTQACALDQNRTWDPSVHRPTLYPPSQTG
ncbi:hypothetical protein QTO34_014541 [Cnephaeus nilssonii]|uniref:Uncharacterized protein n=1 Tax=Cnephaeus nilssonii TaxID=3371016 RepID=A0AA40I6J7_CNENI|nr:hypothetical protein QTO34_014541 [Eptesicus nilssonii]